MRKMIAVFLALLLVLPCIGALAEEENFIRRAVPYPGEDFSIAIPAQYLAFYKEELGLTISAGIAFREDLEEGEDLFKCADIALLQVKERGRRGSAVYEK